MANDYIIDSGSSNDPIKGGLYFGNLAPGASFANIPKVYNVNTASEAQNNNLELTLKKVKDSIKKSLKKEYDYTDDDLATDDSIVENFLYNYTNLLIDYRDLRNFVFFGSSQIEISYNIKEVIKNYPFQTLVSDFVSSFTNITITNDVINNTTTLIFNSTSLTDIGSFTMFDSGNNKFDFTNYEIIDSLGKRYTIIEGIAPYKSNNTSLITDIQDGVDSILITTSSPHDFINNEIVEIYEVTGTLHQNETEINVNSSQLNNTITKRFIVKNKQVNSFEIVEELSLSPLLKNFDYTSGGIVRKYPLEKNIKPYFFKIKIKGLLSQDSLLSFQLSTENQGRQGFLISPKLKKINDFNISLNPIQRQLLAPDLINSTPWPRREITNNIQCIIDTVTSSNTEQDFVDWLKNPNLLYVVQSTNEDVDIAYTDIYSDYTILRAAANDESYSNQLLRRAIPPDVISELNDLDEGYFQRFILIAGWFFDQVYVYVKFIKYVHSLNYSDYNQLSPEYYKYYADHYGFNLFSDDSIDFSSLVVQTEPGITYLSSTVDLTDKYYRNTLQQIEYERQKRLLLSLFFLYKTKGTIACIEKLVSLLGAPDGLLNLSEYKLTFNSLDKSGYETSTNKKRIKDNSKINVPDFYFEIDPQFLVDPVNISSEVNKPYVYKMRLNNETEQNLRELSIQTDPNKAIDTFIDSSYGVEKFDYVKFVNGSFSSLQTANNTHYLLPLSLPNKFTGITVDYMIPRDGFIKEVGSNQEECNVILTYINKVADLSFNSNIDISNITLTNNGSIATITTSGNNLLIPGVTVKIVGVTGINNINNSFVVATVPTSTSFTITGSFTGTYSSSGYVVYLTPNKLSAAFNYSYPLAVQYSNYEEDTLTSNTYLQNNYKYLKQQYSSSTFIDFSDQEYILCRLEGNDLVVRVRYQSENNSNTFIERIGICSNVFTNDGLNHKLRIILKSDCFEVYQDYMFQNIGKWKDPLTNSLSIPYLAIEIPKRLISSCTNSDLDLDSLVSFPDHLDNDKICWNDLLIGLPVNVDFYFKKVEIFENLAVDSFNLSDNILGSNNEDVDSFVLSLGNTIKVNNILQTRVEFSRQEPNVINSDYGWVLPEEVFNNISVIKDTKLYSYLANLSLEERVQDFFNYSDSFKNFAWERNIHQKYVYRNFNGKVLDLNRLFAKRVLSYKSLSGFLDLIENKFRPTIEQFIPIVINISEFGRLIQTSMFDMPKFKYNSSFLQCYASIDEKNAYIQDRIFDYNDATVTTNGDFNEDFNDDFYLSGQTNYLQEGNDLVVSIIDMNSNVILGPITIQWDTDKSTTIVDMNQKLNDVNINQYYPHIRSSIITEVLIMEIDYSWCTDTLNQDANTLKFKIESGSAVREIPFQGGSIKTDNDCSNISMKVPKPFKSPQVYTYFVSENKKPPIIYYNNENKPPRYI